MLSKLAIIWGHPFVIQILADNVLKMLQMVQCSRRGGNNSCGCLSRLLSAKVLTVPSHCHEIVLVPLFLSGPFKWLIYVWLKSGGSVRVQFLLLSNSPSFPVSLIASIMIEKSRAGHILMKCSLYKWNYLSIIHAVRSWLIKVLFCKF